MALALESRNFCVAALRAHKLPYEILCLFNRIEYISPRRERRTTENAEELRLVYDANKESVIVRETARLRKGAGNKVVSESCSFEICRFLSYCSSIDLFIVTHAEFNDAAYAHAIQITVGYIVGAVDWRAAKTLAVIA